MRENRNYILNTCNYARTVTIILLCIYLLSVLTACNVESSKPIALSLNLTTGESDGMPLTTFLEESNQTFPLIADDTSQPYAESPNVSSAPGVTVLEAQSFIPNISERSVLYELHDFEWLSEQTIQMLKNDAVQIDLRRCTYRFLPNEDVSDISVNIDITYPLISGVDTAEKINENIAELVYYIMGEVYALKWLSFLDDYLDMEMRDFDILRYSCEIKCEITFFDEQLISISFRSKISNESRLNVKVDFLTIDFATGRVLDIKDIFPKDGIIAALEMGCFSIEEGMYQPAGWKLDDEYTRQIIAGIVMESLSDDYIIDGERIDSFIPAEFAIKSEKEVLLKLRYYDSLNYFVVIRLSLV